jgi:hypothetical protein
MPSPRDLTGDLVRLRSKKLLQEGVPAPELPVAEMRPMATDPVLWVSGLLILVGLAIEMALIAWMW